MNDGTGQLPPKRRVVRGRKLGVDYPAAFALREQRFLVKYARDLQAALLAWLKADLLPALGDVEVVADAGLVGVAKAYSVRRELYFTEGIGAEGPLSASWWRSWGISPEGARQDAWGGTLQDHIPFPWMKGRYTAQFRADVLVPLGVAVPGVRLDTLHEVEAVLNGLLQNLGTVLTAEVLKQRIYEAVQGIVKYSERSWKKSIKTITGLDPLLRNPPLAEVVQAHLGEHVALIKSIPVDLHAEVERLVYTGVRQGKLIKDIAKEIEGLSGVTEKRANVIARDQAGSLNAGLVREQFRQGNLTTYVWRNMRDERVRGNPAGKYPHAKYSHWEREGRVYSWDDPPPDGNPGEAIECRCKAQIQEAEALGLTDQMVPVGKNYDEALKARKPRRAG